MTGRSGTQRLAQVAVLLEDNDADGLLFSSAVD